jgi:hypothetical protein
MADKLLPIERLNEEHFQRPDGSKYAKIYGAPIYYKSNGKIKHNSEFKLQKDGDEIFTDSDDFTVRIKKNRITFRYDGKNYVNDILGLYVDDELIQAPQNLEPVIDGQTIIFEDFFTGVDLKYTITPHMVQEEFIFRSNPLTGTGQSGEYLYVKYKKSAKGKEKEPWALSADYRHLPVYSKPDRKGLKVQHLYTYKYPIVLDPTISPIASSDAYINSHTTTGFTRTDSGVLCVYFNSFNDGCGTSWTAYNRSYIRFDLSSLAGKTINSATFNITAYNSQTGYQFWAISGAGEVDPETGNAATVYGSAGSGSAIGSFVAGTNGLRSINVKTHVDTHKGGFCDYGIIPTQDSAALFTYFYSSENATTDNNKPYLYIDYSDAAGGNTNLTVQDASHAHTAGVPTLSYTNYYTLEAQNGIHAHTADQPSVTYNQAAVDTALTVQDASHTHSAEAPTLSFQIFYTLVTQDALHSHTAEAPVLSYTNRYALVAQDGLHAHVSEAPILAVTTFTPLTVADASHAHTAENAVLAITTFNPLVVQDGIHAHSAENVSITSKLSVVAQDSTHSVSSESPELTSDRLLAVQAATHPHTAENSALTARNNLNVHDAASAHTADNAEISVTLKLSLVVNDSNHLQTAENVSLGITTLGVLSVQDGVHAHSAASPELSTGIQVTVNGATHVLTSENPDIALNIGVVPANSLHNVSSENAVTILNQVVSVDDAGHVVDSDTPIVRQDAIVLRVQDAFHGGQVVGGAYSIVYVDGEMAIRMYGDNYEIMG